MPFGIGFFAAAGAGGAAGDFVRLETTVLSTTATTVSFTGLSSYSAYRHLQIRFIGRGAEANTSVNGFLRINGDTTNSNYRHHALYGEGGLVGAFQGTSPYIGELAANNATANIFTPKIIDILDFASTSKNTTVRTFWGNNEGSALRIGLYSFLWNNTAAVTSLQFYESSGSGFAAGSRFSLYGIR